MTNITHQRLIEVIDYVYDSSHPDHLEVFNNICRVFIETSNVDVDDLVDTLEELELEFGDEF